MLRMAWSHELAVFGAAAPCALDLFCTSSLVRCMWCGSLGWCAYQHRRSPGGREEARPGAAKAQPSQRSCSQCGLR